MSPCTTSSMQQATVKRSVRKHFKQSAPVHHAAQRKGTGMNTEARRPRASRKASLSSKLARASSKGKRVSPSITW
eukprot:1160513-Pelagomonas_calceolata.AAC.15